MKGKGGREAATEGRAGGGHSGRAAGTAARRGQAGLLLGQTGLAAGLIFGSAEPRIRARHCRAKIGGAAGPATSAVSLFGRRHVNPLLRHHACAPWQ